MTKLKCERCGRPVMVTRAKMINGKPYGRVCAKKVKLPKVDRIAQLEQEIVDLKGIVHKLVASKANNINWTPTPIVPNGDIPINHNLDYADCVSELRTVLKARGGAIN